MFLCLTLSFSTYRFLEAHPYWCIVGFKFVEASVSKDSEHFSGIYKDGDDIVLYSKMGKIFVKQNISNYKKL